jgi:cytochrome b involved in lipid metabolism
MKKIFFLVIGLVIIGSGIYFYKSGGEMNNVTSAPKETINNSNVPPINNPVTGGSDSSGQVTEKTFTMAEVSSHNSRQSCYSTVNGGVYDLTNWIDAHPGGEGAILSICGKDGSSAFEDQHGGQRKPEKELASLKIGILSK